MDDRYRALPLHSVPYPQWAKSLLEPLAPGRVAIRVAASPCNEDFVETDNTHSGREQGEHVQ